MNIKIAAALFCVAFVSVNAEESKNVENDQIQTVEGKKYLKTTDPKYVKIKSHMGIIIKNAELAEKNKTDCCIHRGNK